MRQFLPVLLPALAVAACSAPGQMASGTASEAVSGVPQRQCFFQQQIDNFRAGSSTTLYVKVRGGDVYEVNTSGACTALQDAFRMAIVADAGASRLCTNDWVTVAAPDANGQGQTCRAHIDRKLTEAEVAALPARSRP